MKTRWPLAIAVAAGLALGLWLGRCGPGRGAGDGQAPSTHGSSDSAKESPAQATHYTCSMHPQVRQPEPGLCPICAMDLIPVDSGTGSDGPGGRLELSATAAALAEVETSAVERRYVDARVRMVGRLMADETRMARITAWVPGRIERLFVNYTGIAVNKGDHMAEVYSPQLLTVQHELIMATRSSGGDVLSGLRKSARERLRLWGLSEKQIAEIEKRDEASDTLTILAPSGGIVLEKNVVEGQYVETGATLFRLADLSKLWLHLDAYESDLHWLRYGQEVAFRVAARPGEEFRGVVSFIDPVLDERTRISQVRVVVDNSAGRLKPGMFARAEVHAQVAAGGKVRNPSLEGKWISPMHPEIVKDAPGACDVCGMALVRAEDLGYATQGGGLQPPIVIPATAPLITGRRAVVYVAGDSADPSYEGREVVLGPRAGDWYVVESGLAEGERVVTRGNFKIDSALQIQARSSMMNPPEGSAQLGQAAAAGSSSSDDRESRVAPFEDVSARVREAIDELLDAYYAVGHALASDDPTSASSAARVLARRIESAPHGPMGSEAHVFWMDERRAMGEAAAGIAAGAANIGAARTHFLRLSESLQRVVRRLGVSGSRPVIVFFCPMAFDDRGAEWLQDREGVRNPYFGSQMLMCGEMREQLAP